MINNWEKGIYKISAKEFVPFKPDNRLQRVSSSICVVDEKLKIQATSAFFPLAATIVQSIYDPNCFTEMETLNKVATQRGFVDIVTGETDLLISSDPSVEQMQSILECEDEIEIIQISKEPIVILANRNNPVDNLTLEELRTIYQEETSVWSDFGGTSDSIHTYQLERGNGSQSAFEQAVFKRIQFSEYHHEIVTMPEIVDMAAKDEHGIAYAFATYFVKMYGNTNIKTIRINGKDIYDPQYPIQCGVYLFYKKNHPNDNIRRIAEWLVSEEGKRVIEIGGSLR